MWINARISNGQRLVLASFQWRDVHAGANTGGDAGTTLPRAELQWLFEPSAFIESSGYATLPQTEAAVSARAIPATSRWAVLHCAHEHRRL